MKTNKEQRQTWRQFYQFNPDDILPATTQRILDLIDDVEEATRLLGNIVEAAELVRGNPQNEDLWNELMDEDGHIADAAVFLKEPIG